MFEIADVTGDGIDEIITIHNHQIGGPGTTTGTFDVFDLSQVPPFNLVFDPNAPYSPYGRWSINSENSDEIVMHFEYPTGGDICPETINSDYKWVGDSFIGFRKQYPDIIELSSAMTEESYNSCLEYIFSRLLFDAQFGDTSALHAIEALVSSYPFSSESPVTGKLIPLDARDKLRFQLGLLRAFHGYPEEARQHMMTITTDQVIPDSRWIMLAQQFLSAYHDQTDLLDACLASAACYPLLSLDQIGELIAAQPFETIPTLLQDMGVPVVSFGKYDFDKDGTDEYWLFLESRVSDSLYLHILTQDNGDLIIHDIGSVSDMGPVTIKPLPTNIDVLLFKLQVGDEGEIKFTYKRNPLTSEPVISWHYRYSRMYKDTLNMLAKDLVSGVVPNQLDTDILAIQQYLLDDCDNEIMLSYYCYELYFSQYLLGLAYELSGDEINAVAAYLKLWRDYPNSPYAIMAQAKLQPSR